MRHLFKYCHSLFISLMLFLPLSLQAKPFVIGRLMGQFANQLFIIAATVSLALDNDAQPSFPDLIGPSDPDFKIPFNYEKVFYHLDTSRSIDNVDFFYREQGFPYKPIPYKPNMAIEGWFQSEKYFKHHKQEIIDLFALPPAINNYLTNKYSDIIQHPNTVAIHFRSYSENENPGYAVYAPCNVEYFKKAIALFPEDALFVVFSNQIDWCKKNFSHIERNIRFIEGESHHHDFYLMSMCKHAIICNSTFSWWAAYINRNPDKVIVVPSVWFSPAYNHDAKDLIPEEWIILN